MIAAISDNFVIGLNNRMPWHLPEDLKLFKQRTLGNIIIMGRKTFESIGRPLPGRTTIVISSSDKVRETLGESGIKVCADLESALKEAASAAEKPSAKNPKIFVAGGASVYAQAIDGAQQLYISRVPGNFDGDTFFPKFTNIEWRLTGSEKHADFTLESYSRQA